MGLDLLNRCGRDTLSVDDAQAALLRELLAAPEGEATRFAHFEGARFLGRLGRPLFARKIEGDFDRIERWIAERDREA